MKAIKGKFFSRGIHIKDMKELSASKEIEILEPQELVLLSLSQHIGKQASPIVSVGDKVLMGQLIATADGLISANVYSSVSGEVMGFEERLNPKGNKSNFVVIKNDFKYTATTLSPLENFESESILNRIREAGIVGMGGAGFPTYVKLSPKTKVDTLVINGAECEPYLTCDYRLMIERFNDLVEGILLLKKALKVEKILVGIETNKPDAIKLFESIDSMQVVALKKRYPMGSEKHLIYCATGRKVPVGKLPSDVGVVVQNISTAIAVYEAVKLNKPLYERAMTVSGKGIVNPKNLLVKFGTSFETVFNYCGGKKTETVMLISGGPMMGSTMLSTDYYTKKTDSGLLVLDKSEADAKNPSLCINCGRCASVCPMKLMPMTIDFFTQHEEYEKAKEFGGVLNCIECGCCSYVCPAKRSLLQSITLCKSKLRK